MNQYPKCPNCDYSHDEFCKDDFDLFYDGDTKKNHECYRCGVKFDITLKITYETKEVNNEKTK